MAKEFLNNISTVSTEYELLKYQLCPDKFRNHYTFNTKPRILKKYKMVDYDYHHAGFGNYRGDIEEALGHFKYVLGELQEEKDPDVVSGWLDQLEADFVNISGCYPEGSLPVILEQLTGVLFHYGRWQKVLGVAENQLSSIEGPEGVQPYAFDELFVRMGDRLLLRDNEPENAFKLYRIACEDWIPRDFEGQDYIEYDADRYKMPETMFDQETKSAWTEAFRSYKSVLAGGYGTENDRGLPFMSAYKELISLTPGYTNDETVLHKTDQLFQEINAFMDSQHSEREYFHEARLAAIITGNVSRKFLVTVLYRLSFENEDVRKNYTYGIQRCASRIVDEEDKVLFEKDSVYPEKKTLQADNTDFKLPSEQSGAQDYDDEFFRCVRIAKYRDYILDELRVKDSNVQLAYYCPLSTFRYMLPADNTKDDKLNRSGKAYNKIGGSDNAGKCGRLSIMNISYMNDPNDGRMLEKVLFGQNPESEAGSRTAADAPYVFIKCFTERIDYLPMWQMYGDGGAGCCLVVDWKDDLSLYRTCYLKQDGRFSVRASDNNHFINSQFIQDVIVAIRRIIHEQDRLRKGETSADHAKRCAGFHKKCRAILGGAVYLFKDYAYSYEQESRIMRQYPSASEEMQHTKESIPKLFVYTENPIQLTEVILGPKMKDTADTLPWLREQIEKMCRINGREMPKITFSGIEYR